MKFRDVLVLLFVLLFASCSFFRFGETGVGSPTSCGRLICGNDTYTGTGNLSGKTWNVIQNTFAKNYYNNTHGWNQSQNWTNNSIQYLWFPWYASSSDLSETNLKDTYTQSAFGINATWVNNTDVSDEGSELSMSSVMNWTYNQFKLWENYMDVCADRNAAHTSQGPWLTSWVCTQNNGNITKSDENSASDATARLQLTAFMGCHSPTFSASEQADACARAVNISRASIAEEWVTSCQNSTVNTSSQLCRWHLAGAAQAFGPAALNQSGQQMFFGYHESDTMACLAAYAYTHNESFSACAKNETHQFLYVVGFKNQGNSTTDFNYTTGSAHYYMNCTGTPGICITATTGGTTVMDDSDAPRAWEMCNNVHYAEITYGKLGEALPWEFVALRRYCESWAARMGPSTLVKNGDVNFSNSTSACYRFRGTNATCDSTGIVGLNSYKPAGWVSNMVAYLQNVSYWNTFVSGSLSTYSNVSDTYAGDSAFGTYDQVRYLRSIRSQSGYFDFLFSNDTFNGTLYGLGLPYNYTSAAVVVSNGTITSTASIIELGTLVNLTGYANASVCFDVDAVGYGINSSCGGSPLNQSLNITLFQKTVMNDSLSSKNLSYNSSATSNKTIYIRANSKDLVNNLTMYLRGFSTNGSFPTNVKIFVNNTYANPVGLLLNSTIQSLTTFNDSNTSSTVNFTTANTTRVGYFKIPKYANVNNAVLTLNGTSTLSLQENPDATAVSGSGQLDINYSKPTGALNTTVWRVKLGTNAITNFTFTSFPSCWNATTSTLLLRATALRTLTGGSRPTSSSAQCYNGTGWQNVTQDAGTCSDGSGCSGSGSSVSILYDGDYTSKAIYGVAEGTWETVGTHSLDGAFYEESIYWKTFPVDSWMEVGTVTGTRDWNYTGAFSATDVSSNFSSKINSFLQNCAADENGYCYVPVYVYSLGGVLILNNISINYTFDVNPIAINKTVLQGFINRSNGTVDVPITFQDEKNGTIEISNISYRYIGGNSTVNITLHLNNGTVLNTSTLVIVASTWNYSLPRNVRYLEFIPSTPFSRNVSAYGQTPTSPFLNLTNTGYGWPSFNFSIISNSTDSCVNLSVGNTSNATLATRLTNNWTYLYNNVTLGSSGGLWFFADYYCNSSAWRIWKPRISLRACAWNSTCSTSVT